jgi:hypothetical protein
MTRLPSRAIDSTVPHIYKQAIEYPVAQSLTWLSSRTNPVLPNPLMCEVLCTPKSFPLVSITVFCLER